MAGEEGEEALSLLAGDEEVLNLIASLDQPEATDTETTSEEGQEATRLEDSDIPDMEATGMEAAGGEDSEVSQLGDIEESDAEATDMDISGEEDEEEPA
jgi:hypothetical protein